MGNIILLSDGTPHELGQTFVPSIEVIAKSLAYTNRYNGHNGQYSVAEHSVLVSHAVPREFALDALLHDATEAYLGDMVAPLKRMIPQFEALESFYHDVIDRHYGVQTRHAEVREADLRMLITEARHYGMNMWYMPDAEPYAGVLDAGAIKGLNGEDAQQRFLERFKELTS